MKPARRQVAKALPPRNPHAAGVVSPFGPVLGDCIVACTSPKHLQGN
jgi:hypothetical protein